MESGCSIFYFRGKSKHNGTYTDLVTSVQFSHRSVNGRIAMHIFTTGKWVQQRRQWGFRCAKHSHHSSVRQNLNNLHT